ncbi:MAG: helix-turn-helix domain-containing protein [Chloroflexia bacterium]
MSSYSFKFIDLPTAAERLGTTRNELLKWVDDGRIRPFNGKGQASVFRTSDVDRLAAEILASATAVEEEPVEAEESEDVSAPPGLTPQLEARRAKRRDAIKLMGTRLSMDSRWAEMTDKDIATWLDALEAVQFDRIRRVASHAIERLQRVLIMMDEFEAQNGTPNTQEPRPLLPNS